MFVQDVLSAFCQSTKEVFSGTVRVCCYEMKGLEAFVLPKKQFLVCHGPILALFTARKTKSKDDTTFTSRNHHL